MPKKYRHIQFADRVGGTAKVHLVSACGTQVSFHNKSDLSVSVANCDINDIPHLVDALNKLLEDSKLKG